LLVSDLPQFVLSWAWVLLCFRTYPKQTLASLLSPRRTFVLSSAPGLASAILRKSFVIACLFLMFLLFRVWCTRENQACCKVCHSRMLLAGIQWLWLINERHWTPAFAGVTVKRLMVS
jgi:hypothetical protein